MNRIHLFNHAFDAWEDSLRNWLERESAANFSNRATWLVTGSFVQANWIRKMALRSSCKLFGVQFMDLRMLRRKLYRAYNLPSPSFGREAIELLLQTALRETSNFDAHHLLSALDELWTSGWLDKHSLDQGFSLLRFPMNVRPALKALIDSEFWKARADTTLLARVKPCDGLSLGIYGLDAEESRNIDLLHAASKHASETEAWLAQPIQSETASFSWISALEEKLGANVTVCPIGEALRPYESFIAHWRAGGEPDCIRPQILVGDRWNDQIEALVHSIADALLAGGQDIVVVVPENSSTGPALVDRLVSQGIAVADEYRERQPLPRLAEIQVLIAKYLSEDRSPETLLKIVEFLFARDYPPFRKALFRAFDERQTRSGLIDEEFCQRFAWLRELESLLEAWPDEADWAELRERWKSTLKGLAELAGRQELASDLSATEGLEAVFREISRLLFGQRLSSRRFLEFTQRLLAVKVGQRHPGASNRYANVIVTTPAKAHGCSWGYVFLADSFAESWPRAIVENSVFPDEMRLGLRRQGFFLPTASERRQLQEDRFLQIAYPAQAKLVLARYELDHGGNALVANDLSTFVEDLLHSETTRFRSSETRGTTEPRLSKVHAGRINPELPFDEYFLNFSGTGPSTRAWFPSELEKAIKTPATFAFDLVFGCRREWDRRFSRSTAMTVGRLVHRLLQETFGTQRSFVAVEESHLLLLGNNLQNAVERMLRERAQPVPDLWWESVMGQATMVAARMFELAADWFLPGLWYQAEGEMEGVYDGLRLRGRTDLVLSDRADMNDASLKIADFKTSRLPIIFRPSTGDGLQFVGYRLLALANGAQVVRFTVIRPEELKPIKFPSDEKLIPIIERLARIQSRLVFGRRRGAKYGQSEVLPIATLDIPAAVLEKKMEITNGSQ
jgi:PD-(D/E)XK nuclease superfamily protein